MRRRDDPPSLKPERRNGAGAARRAQQCVRARAKAYTALQDRLVTAPTTLRERLAGRYKDPSCRRANSCPSPEHEPA
jgi:hypothetical protein